MSSTTKLAWFTKVAEGLLIALAAILPFEAPLCHVGRLQLTSVEAVLYLTLAAWGLIVLRETVNNGWRATRLAPFAWTREPLALATMGWAAVVFVTAALASDRIVAGKFALRSLSGILLFFATRTLTRAAPSLTRRIVLALVAGAIVSAVSALVEAFVPQATGWFGAFRDESFDTFGLRRASGVFGYPTIGAMYWEAALPLDAVVTVATLAAQRRLTLAVTAILAGAITASATRSSLAGGAVTCTALFVLTREHDWGRDVSRRALATIGALVATSVLAVALPGAGTLLGERLRFWHDDAWFGVTYSVPDARRHVETDERFVSEVTLHNTGTLTWRHGGTNPTRVASHWYRVLEDAPETLVRFDGRRTQLDGDVAPGSTATVEAVATAPSAPGTYRLAWDVVQEGITWFSEHGNKTADVTVEVVQRTSAMPASLTTEVAPRVDPPPPPRRALWRAAVSLFREHPLTGAGPDGFRRRYESVLSPAPNGAPYLDTRIHANSFYFETLADMGLLGMVALIALGTALVRATLGHVRRRNALGLGVSMAAASFFVHGLSDYFLEFTPAFGLFWMLLGLTGAAAPSATLEGAAGTPP